MEHARPQGVTIAIEPINRFETYFINRADQAIALPGSLDENPENVSPEDRKFIEDHGSNLLSESFYAELVNTSAKTLLPLIGQ